MASMNSDILIGITSSLQCSVDAQTALGKSCVRCGVVGDHRQWRVLPEETRPSQR